MCVCTYMSQCVCLTADEGVHVCGQIVRVWVCVHTHIHGVHVYVGSYTRVHLKCNLIITQCHTTVRVIYPSCNSTVWDETDLLNLSKGTGIYPIMIMACCIKVHLYKNMYMYSKEHTCMHNYAIIVLLL